MEQRRPQHATLSGVISVIALTKKPMCHSQRWPLLAVAGVDGEALVAEVLALASKYPGVGIAAPFPFLICSICPVRSTKRHCHTTQVRPIYYSPFLLDPVKPLADVPHLSAYELELISKHRLKVKSPRAKDRKAWTLGNSTTFASFQSGGI